MPLQQSTTEIGGKFELVAMSRHRATRMGRICVMCMRCADNWKTAEKSILERTKRTYPLTSGCYSGRGEMLRLVYSRMRVVQIRTCSICHTGIIVTSYREGKWLSEASRIVQTKGLVGGRVVTCRFFIHRGKNERFQIIGNRIQNTL